MNIATRNTLMLLSDHIGKLTYSMPDSGFVHEINDVGVTVEKDGRERISAKIYKRTDDMTEISIWEYGDYDHELIQEFKERHSIRTSSSIFHMNMVNSRLLLMK